MLLLGKVWSVCRRATSAWPWVSRDPDLCESNDVLGWLGKELLNLLTVSAIVYIEVVGLLYGDGRLVISTRVIDTHI